MASKGATRLAGHADALAAAVAKNAGASAILGNIRLADSSDSFAFAFAPGEGADKVEIRATYHAISKYPRTRVSLSCAQDADVAATLAILEDRTNAAAPKLLEDLCDLYGVDTGGLFDTLEGDLAQAGDGSGESDDEDCGGDEDLDSDADGGGGSSGRDSDGDCMADMAEVESRSLTIACAQRQGRWERHEAAHQQRDEEAAEREAMERMSGVTGAGALSMEQGRAKRQQIFAPWEAFRMLSKELLDIMRKSAAQQAAGGQPAISADTPGDDIYVWDVSLSGFSAESRLGRGLARLQDRCGYGSVELRVAFTRGLHPFYPPKVEVVRPRMHLALCYALASHPLLSLDRWDPCKPCADLLRDLRSFLELHGEVECDSPMNSRSDFPLSSYAPLEQQLVALQAVSWEPAQAATVEQYAPIYRTLDALAEAGRRHALEQQQQQQASRVKRDSDGKVKPSYWAAGTGYGNSEARYSEVWDKEKTLAAQAARDAELEAVLLSLVALMKCHIASTGDSGGSGGGEAMSEDLKDLVAASEPYKAVLSPESLWEGCQLSCLLPLLGRELALTSFNDMSTRCHYYSTWLQVLQQLVRLGNGQGKIMPIPKRLAESLRGLVAQAQNFLKVVTKGKTREAAGNSAAASKDSEPDALPISRLGLRRDDEADKGAVPLAELIVTTHLSLAATMSTQLDIPDSEGHGPGATSGGPAQSSQAGVQGSTGESAQGQNDLGNQQGSAALQGSAGDEGKQAIERYCRELKEHQLECGSFSAEFVRHHYQNELRKETVHPQSRIIKVGREIAALETMLPLHPASSIFVRVDEEFSMLWRVMITGPEDTPYSCGCFVFDVYFPVDYPGVPPKVNLQTTGGGSVRFNPNLYSDGKVCLSLLGTWDGHKSETWDPKVSSIIQVLVSIQSLILVSQPYFNEPGYEKDMASQNMQNMSENYNRNIRENMLRHAVLGHLQKPPPEFKAAIEGHMRLRREKIIAQCEDWIADAEAKGFREHRNAVKSYLQKIRPLLEKLQ